MNLTEEQKIVRDKVNELIYSGCSYDLENLEKMYHDDLVIVILNEDETILTLNKEQNMEFFASKKRAGAPPMDMTVEFKYVEVNNDYANVIVIRQIDLFEKTNTVYFSLFLRKTNNAWKVYRENAFVLK